MKEGTQNKDLKIRARCYDLGVKEEQNEYSKIEEIIYINLQNSETLHTLC